MTAVYIFVMNLLPHHVNKRETYLTTQVISNRDLKTFGFNRCFTRLVADVNELISNGLQVTVGGPVIPVRLAQYRLDNLERNKVFLYIKLIDFDILSKTFTNCRSSESQRAFRQQDFSQVTTTSQLRQGRRQNVWLTFCLKSLATETKRHTKQM